MRTTQPPIEPTSQSGQFLRWTYGSALDNLLALPILKRLRSVQFLGVTAIIFRKTDSNRLDHSLAVADLALWLAQQLCLSEKERDVVVLYYLLHDVGHMPNSHVTEPLLRLFHSRVKFHDTLGRVEVRSDERIREWCCDILTNGQAVWDLLSEVWNHDLQGLSLPCAQLIETSINVDSVEGIWRSAQILGISCPRAVDVLRGIQLGTFGALEFDEGCLPTLIEFWRAQSWIYGDVVFGLPNQAAEAMWKKAVGLALVEGVIEHAEDFHRFTDEEAKSAVCMSSSAKELIDLLEDNQCLRPMWVTDLARVWRGEGSAAAAAVNENLTRLVELDRMLLSLFDFHGLHTKLVAPHFTRLRRFFINEELINQCTFVNRTLKELEVVLQVKKTPGLVPLSVFGFPAVAVEEIAEASNQFGNRLDKNVWSLLQTFARGNGKSSGLGSSTDEAIDRRAP